MTDLVHLRGDVLAARSDGAVITGVLPVYGVFIALGLVSYALVLARRAGSSTGQGLAAGALGRGGDARRVRGGRRAGPRGPAQQLGAGDRAARTAERIVLTLTWPWAP